MHVTLYGFVLFLHILVAIVAFMMAGVVHVGLPALVRARDVREMRSWAAILHRLEPLFPIAALLLLGFGFWLIHLSTGADQIHFSDGWLLTAFIALIVVEGLSGALLAPKAKAAVRAVEEAADGPVPSSVRDAALEPAIWYLSHIGTFGFAGVVFLMAAKPNGAFSIVVVVVASAIGVALARLQLQAFARVPAPDAAATAPAAGH